jgi:hypothetical protein
MLTVRLAKPGPTLHWRSGPLLIGPRQAEVDAYQAVALACRTADIRREANCFSLCRPVSIPVNWLHWRQRKAMRL